MSDATLSFPALFPSGRTSVGVAIEIPEPYAAVLQAARLACGDPWAHVIGPHVTLVPPTALPTPDLDGTEAVLARAAALFEPFAMELTGTDTFRPASQVVFVRVGRGSTECDALQAAARQGPLAQVLRFPFHPHVTLAHDAPDAELDSAQEEFAGFTASFTVRSFWLYELDPEGTWHGVRSFSLGR